MEQRQTFRLLAIWHEAKGNAAKFPSLEALQLAKYPDIHEMTFIIDVMTEDPKQFYFDYFGHELSNIFDHDHTGALLEDAFMENDLLRNTISFCTNPLRTKMPACESSVFQVSERNAYYRSLVVPVSSNGKKIDFLVGTANYKIK
jgi:hypothetical protein